MWPPSPPASNVTIVESQQRSMTHGVEASGSSVRVKRSSVHKKQRQIELIGGQTWVRGLIMRIVFFFKEGGGGEEAVPETALRSRGVITQHIDWELISTSEKESGTRHKKHLINCLSARRRLPDAKTTTGVGSCGRTDTLPWRRRTGKVRRVMKHDRASRRRGGLFSPPAEEFGVSSGWNYSFGDKNERPHSMEKVCAFFFF